MRITNCIIYPSDEETLDELTERTEDNLNIFSKRRLDYSATIEKHVDENYIIIRSIMMKESAN